MKDNQRKNRALARYLLLPTIFLIVSLLGGLRISAETRAFVFIAPPLITLLLSLLLMVLFARGQLINFPQWLSSAHPTLTNISHALTLLALFFASAQSFNSVLPEAGLLRWMFSFFFLWTLWNNLFSSFDARRLLRSLTVLFGTAFVFKHLLLANLYAPDGGWLKRLAGALLEGLTLGTPESFAPATGYISFFTIALYVGGLMLVAPTPEDDVLEETGRNQLARVERRVELLEERPMSEARALHEPERLEIRSPKS